MARHIRSRVMLPTALEAVTCLATPLLMLSAALAQQATNTPESPATGKTFAVQHTVDFSQDSLRFGMSIPPVRRTWGPRGQTPRIRYSYKHDKVSAVSAVTVSPTRRRLGLYCQLHRKNIQQAEVCQFLRHLLRHLRGHVIVVWDNGKPHKGEPIRDLCRRFPRLHLERFPAYAPELHPDEGVWNQMDNALANGRPDDLDELSAALNKTLRHLRRSQFKLRWCVHQSELPPFLP